MIDENLGRVILDRVWATFANSIDCPNCESRTDDPDFTCEVCWCVGGDGYIKIEEIISTFDVKPEFAYTNDY